MKKMLLFTALLLISTIGLAASTDPAARPEQAGFELVWGDESNGTSELTIAGGTMMIPARKAATLLGVELSWDTGTRTLSATKGESRLDVTAGKTTAQRNGAAFTLDAPPVLDDDTLLVPLRVFCETFGAIVRWDGIGHKVTILPELELLPRVGSFDRLKTLLADYRKQNAVKDKATASFAAPAAAGAVASISDSAASTQKADFSATNVQVDGVDEGDLVKTDGEFVYQVNGSRVIIARAVPADEMKVVQTLTLEDATPTELYIDDRYLIVIASAHRPFAASGSSAKTPNPGFGSVKAFIYDISDKANIRQVRQFEIGGQYVSSRKIGSSLYLIANQYVDAYRLDKETAETQAPLYRDGLPGAAAAPQQVPFDDIRYFPGNVSPNYLVVGAVDLARPDQPANVKAFLGGGQNVYASLSNLYVTLYESRPDATSGKSQKLLAPESNGVTSVYKFSLDGANVRVTGKGEVPGTVLNQFAMDEKGPYFRIATTTGSVFRTDEQTSKNNVYVLDESMSIVGKLEDIAPGEKIYSVRFMGDRGYMVTFKKVDPLFVLDLADPQSPAVLGKLKIPGYSDYLHPYDETHLIGFGKDAADAPGESRLPGGADFAYYQGMKIAMFDVTDVSNPKEMFQTIIGDRGTDSELLRDHRALLFSRERNLLAFPVTVMERTEAQRASGRVTEYGQFAFQGAYVYRVDLTNGFQLQAQITHRSEQEQLKAGAAAYGGPTSIDRVLYIGSSLYTLSRSELRATDLATFALRGRLLIP